VTTPGAEGSLALIIFLVCVACATYAQNLTGFAFGLILLGLTATFHVTSVADAANAAMVLTLVNAWTSFRGQSEPPPWRLMRPALATSLCGVAIGVGLLGWLSGGAVNHLRGLLGISILGCATLLFLQTRSRSTLSSPWSFAFVGMLSGMLGGLFASSGPPLVYHMYRQPLERDRIRLALLLVFACNAFVRLILVVLSGQFSSHALLLAACAIPVVYGVTRHQLRHRPTLEPATLRRIVAVLLLISGSTLLISALNTAPEAVRTGQSGGEHPSSLTLSVSVWQRRASRLRQSADARRYR
jgi:uncharacterized protein